MPTELWFRNPHNYIRELVEAGGEYNIAWDRGALVKSKVDPIKHAELYFGAAVAWRVLAIGENGTAEYRPGDSKYQPTAVYPTWSYGEDQALLEELIEQPVGEDEEICSNDKVAGDERPVLGQDHMVVITNIPDSRSGPGRAFFSYLRLLQEDHPACKIFIHGSYSYRIAFGLEFACADIDPRTLAQKGNVLIPTGKVEKFESAANHGNWLTAFGFTIADLAIPSKRCIFNIKSARWAADHFAEMFNMPLRNTGKPVDTTTPRSVYKALEQGKALVAKGGEGDKFHCDTCSLQNDCKYYRAGSVCGIPGAEPKALSSFFNTRDADSIIDGLGIIVAANAGRLDRGLAEETALGGLSSDVTKLIGQVFTQGQSLAKLIDPNLRGGSKVQVNVGAGSQASVVAQIDPRQVVASVIKELDSKGVSREDITPEMISNTIKSATDPDFSRRQIEATRYINESGEAI